MLTTPYVNTIPMFDATGAYIFRFNVLSGDKILSNRLIIYQYSSVTHDYTMQIYNSVENNNLFSHSLPANTLNNGNKYVYQIQTYSVINATTSTIGSDLSTKIPFQCCATPTLSFDNMPTDKVITNTNYSFNIKYTQINSVHLSEYNILVYDTNQNVLWESPTYYDASTLTPPCILTHVIGKFDNNTQYYIECRGVTEGDNSVTTGLVLINVSYSYTENILHMSATNNYNGGYIKVGTHLKAITGTATGTVSYINNAELDLSNGSSVKFPIGIASGKNFMVTVLFRNVTLNQTLLSFPSSSGNNDALTFTCVPSSVPNAIRVQLAIGSTNTIYVYSNSIPIPLSTDKITLSIKRINGLFSLSLIK